jgi:hypothetical protein
MSEVNNLSPDQEREIDHLYRRLSALDPARPSEWVRRKVLAYAAQQAAERSVRESAKVRELPGSATTVQKAHAALTEEAPTAKRSLLLPAGLAAAAAVVLVGFIVVPKLMAPRANSVAAASVPPVGQPEPDASQTVQEPQPVAAAEPGSPAEPATVAQSTEEPHPASLPPPRQSMAPVPANLGSGASRAKAVSRLPAAPPSRTPVASARAQPAEPAVAGQTASVSVSPPASASAAVQSAAVPEPEAPVAGGSSSLPAPSAISEVPRPVPASVSAPNPAPPTSQGELFSALESRDMNRLQAVLAGKVDLNGQDAKGRTPLTLAIEHGTVAQVRLLLAHGADPNTADAQHMLPIDAAHARHSEAMVMALESNGRH